MKDLGIRDCNEKLVLLGWFGSGTETRLEAAVCLVDPWCNSDSARRGI